MNHNEMRPEDTLEFKTGSVRQLPRGSRSVPLIDYNAVPKVEKKGTQISRRDRLTQTLAATALLAGIGAKYGSTIKDTVADAFDPAQHHKYTQTQLSKMDQAQKTVHTQDGVDSLILSVDPQLHGQGLADVESYVQSQGIAGPNHELLDLQAVDVPVIHDK